MKLKNIILCPSKAGQLKKGVENFPQLMKKYIKPNFNIINTKNDHNIFLNSNNIYNASINSNNNIYIGGDHSISIATGAVSLNKYKNVKFIWIDAHADINTYKKSVSKNYHGMPLAFLTGLDKNKYFPFIKNNLRFNNLCYIGLRDVDSFENRIINKKKILSLPHDKINNDFHSTYYYISKFINGAPVHISFDVDSINPKYISSTGTIVNKGLDLYPAKKLFKTLFEKENVIGLDIVEMNMNINKEEYDKSLKNFLGLFPHIFTT